MPASRPAGSPGQTAQPGQIEQINETFSNGGPGCLWKTIEHTTRIRLDHFAELNFTGFEHVINDLGGVRICLPIPINDPRSKLHLAAGIHHVGGAAALAYWRVRYIGVGSDLERIQRDQFLMASVAQKVKQTNLLGDPAQVFRVVRDVAESLTTDSGLKQSEMIALVQRLQTMPLRAVHFVQVPVVTYPPNPNWVQWSDQASRLFLAIAHDHKLPRSAHGHGRRHEQTGGGVAASRPQHSVAASPKPVRRIARTFRFVRSAWHAPVALAAVWREQALRRHHGGRQRLQRQERLRRAPGRSLSALSVQKPPCLRMYGATWREEWGRGVLHRLAYPGGSRRRDARAAARPDHRPGDRGDRLRRRPATVTSAGRPASRTSSTCSRRSRRWCSAPA